MKKGLYAGTFDPFTNGHQAIVERALKIFDQITILVATSPNKKTFWNAQKRVDVLNQIYKNNPNVCVDSWDGLVIDYADKNNFVALIRGLRPTGDFENEFQMASMNRKLNESIETTFFMTGEGLYYVSSSLVREVFGHGGDIKAFVPDIVYNELLKSRTSK